MAAHSPGLVQSGGIKMFYGPNIPYQWNDAFMQLLLIARYPPPDPIRAICGICNKYYTSS
jgi:hypothetical protein